jgi:hypothetical protein
MAITGLSFTRGHLFAIDPNRLPCPEIRRCSKTVIVSFPVGKTNGNGDRITGPRKIASTGDPQAGRRR